MDNEDNGVTQVRLILSNPSSFDISVLVIYNIIAMGLNNSKHLESNNNHLNGVHNLTFPANATLQTIDIPICNDSVLEEDKTLSLIIGSNSHSDNVTNGSPDHIIVTINRKSSIVQ